MNTKIDIEELIEELEKHEFSVRPYLGRGMYACECLGVETDNPISTLMEIIKFIYELSDGDDSKFRDYIGLFRSPRSEGFGLSSILIFPNTPWPE
jgi:hypothetical protein